MVEAHPQFKIFNKLTKGIETVRLSAFKRNIERQGIEEMFDCGFPYLAIARLSGLDFIPNPQVFQVKVGIEIAQKQGVTLSKPNRHNIRLNGNPPLWSYHLSSSDRIPKTLLIMGHQWIDRDKEFNILKVVYDPSAPEPKWPDR